MDQSHADRHANVQTPDPDAARNRTVEDPAGNLKNLDCNDTHD